MKRVTKQVYCEKVEGCTAPGRLKKTFTDKISELLKKVKESVRRDWCRYVRLVMYFRIAQNCDPSSLPLLPGDRVVSVLYVCYM